MKKIVSLALALMLVFSALTVLAEETVSTEDIEVTIPGGAALDVTPRDAAAFSADGDVVTVDGNTYVVVADNLTYTLELDPALGMIVLTRDYFVSMANAWQLGLDMDAFVEYCASNGTHILLYSQYTGAEIDIRSMGLSDRGSMTVGNLSAVSAEYQAAFLSSFAQVNEMTANGLIIAGDNVWMQMDDTVFLTVVGGEYVIVNVYPDGEMTEDDVADVTDVLSCLTIEG